VPEASSRDDKVQPRGKERHKALSARWSEQTWTERKKRQLVSTLNEEWKGTGVMVIAHYKGMTVAQMTDFRKRMKDAGGSVKVAKNKLAMLALKDTDAAGISESPQGADVLCLLRGPGERGQGLGQVLAGERQARDPGRDHGQGR
jgi:hypothetical protein